MKDFLFKIIRVIGFSFFILFILASIVLFSQKEYVGGIFGTLIGLSFYYFMIYRPKIKGVKTLAKNYIAPQTDNENTESTQLTSSEAENKEKLIVLEKTLHKKEKELELLRLEESSITQRLASSTEKLETERIKSAQESLSLSQRLKKLKNLNNSIIDKEEIIENLKQVETKLVERIATSTDILENKEQMINEIISDLNIKNEAVKAELLNNAKEELASIKLEITRFADKKKQLEQDVVYLENQAEMESHGIYTPQYDFASSLSYKAKLDELRGIQKQMVRNKTATLSSTNWTVNGSHAKGKKMTNDNIKQLLRSFNNECEAAINKVRYSNIEIIKKRIMRSYEQLNKMNETNSISIRPDYLDLKLSELNLAYEYELKKQSEKEELREQREIEREEKALAKEIQSKKKIIDKDISHYHQMIIELEKKSLSADSTSLDDIRNQISDIENKVQEKEKEKEELDYRNAHASAGYVYIISNVGAFGEDVVKIGVTRRLEPLERISELSSASVPFKFDVHALIFSYEAYRLEKELHRHFEKFRINRVNSRKEFFKVPIGLIEDKLSEYKELTIDFKRIPDADEFKESEVIRKSNEAKQSLAV